MEPLRIFVGTSPGGQDAEACTVLEHSLRRRASIPVRVELLRNSGGVLRCTGGWMSERWTTPWTALRWAVPELCKFAGRAVYFDCPTLVLDDVAALARAPMPEAAALLVRRSGRTLATACIVFDCARAAHVLPRIDDLRSDVGAHQTVGHILERRPALAAPLPGNWGASDSDFGRRASEHYESVHFERPHTQPHIPRSRARLARAGKQHWFDGITLPHYCEALARMYEAEYGMIESEAAE